MARKPQHKPQKGHKTGFRGPSPDVGKATQFKKGQPSANPGGRPKRKVLSDAYRAKLEELVPNDPKSRTYAEFIADQLVMDALRSKNKVPAAAEIADRTEGKARQAYEVKMSIIDELADRVKRARERAAIKE